MTPRVLFVCVHNAGRSQMAAVLLDHHALGRIQVLSAGTSPSSELHPLVVAAMSEWGIDMSDRSPTPLATSDVEGCDVVVTMGCGDSCPVVKGVRYEDWQLDDPSGQDLEAVRKLRAEIDARVRTLVSELLD